MSRKATSVRLIAENDSKIRAIAKRDSLTMGQVINKIIKEYSGKKEEINETTLSVINKELSLRFENYEKELAMQRQRTNILKNQIDHLIRTQNEKGRINRYTEYNKSK